MKRGSFASRFGTIAAVGGSVIGLGNIWRFPYVAGENGGAAFILIYLTISFLISIPIMLSEFSLGRSTKRNSMRAFSKLAPGTKWKWVGYMGILCAFIILSFYCVIAGWSLEFLKESVLNRFHDRTPEQVAAAFDGFVASGWRPIAWTLVFIAASAFIVYSGIEKGIERYNKILMPMLFLLLFGMALNALTLDGARQGIDFLLKPDFSKITGTTVLEALGQSFFSMSLGMGCMSMGMGYGLSEQLILDEKTGRPLNGTLLDYKLMTMMDTPDIKADFVELDDPIGPFGNKALGEPPAIPGAPAIRNAVLHATGVAFNENPLTPQRLIDGFIRAGLI